jgi:2-hydroxycyclohexanecarboxyl-CoA dehydrogenase
VGVSSPSLGMSELEAAADGSRRRFDDAVVIVTGAGGGIGAGISARFAVEGAHVNVCDANDMAAVSVADTLTSRGLRPQARIFDVTYADACRALAEQTVSEYSRIDVLVNNAGINRRGDLLSLNDDDWSTTFAVNVDAMFHPCRVVLPHMIDAGHGAIVNTASQWACTRRLDTSPTTCPRPPWRR